MHSVLARFSFLGTCKRRTGKGFWLFFLLTYLNRYCFYRFDRTPTPVETDECAKDFTKSV